MASVKGGLHLCIGSYFWTKLLSPDWTVKSLLQVNAEYFTISATGVLLQEIQTRRPNSVVM